MFLLLATPWIASNPDWEFNSWGLGLAGSPLIYPAVWSVKWLQSPLQGHCQACTLHHRLLHTQIHWAEQLWTIYITSKHPWRSSICLQLFSCNSEGICWQKIGIWHEISSSVLFLWLSREAETEAFSLNFKTQFYGVNKLASLSCSGSSLLSQLHGEEKIFLSSQKWPHL